jgi:hypothetical protein
MDVGWPAEHGPPFDNHFVFILWLLSLNCFIFSCMGLLALFWWVWAELF